MFDFLYDGIFIPISKNDAPKLKEMNLCGGRFSGKTTAIIELITLLMLKCENVYITVLRFSASGKDATFKDIKQNLIRFIDRECFNLSSSSITYKTNYLKCYSLNEPSLEKKNKKGLFNPDNAKFILIWEEEADELPELATKEIELSIRSKNEQWKGIIRSSNPNIAANWYVNKVIKGMKEDKKLLQSCGYQLKVDNDILYFRNNYRTNPYLKDYVINQIEDWKNISYEKWKVASLGLAGNYDGGIYTPNLHNMRKFNAKDDFKGIVSIGIDWGDSTMKNGGDTAIEVVVINPYSFKCDVIDELYLNNYELQQDSEYLINKCVDYCSKFLQYSEFIEVWVDNAAFQGFFQLFQSRADELGYYGLQFKPITSALKNEVPINMRIDIVNYMINTSLLAVNSKCKYLWQSLNNCYYEPVNKWKEELELKRSHDYTHAINGFEYAILKYIPDIAEKGKYKWLLKY